MVLVRDVDTDFLTALSEPFFYPVIMVYLDWPAGELRMHSGVGTIDWDGEDWVGVGDFGSVALPEESFGLASSPAQLRLVGLPDDLDDKLEAPIRNRRGIIYFGVVTERGGNVLIGDPLAIYDGYMDALSDTVEVSEEDGTKKLLRGVRLSLASGPSQRSFAEVYHTYEDQARAYPAEGTLPSLYLQFVGASALPGSVSITRASIGTYTGADGAITSFASGAARLGDRGLLVEEERTNSLVRSQEFNTTWTIVGATVSADAAAAPDGTTTADKLMEAAAAGTHIAVQVVTKATAAQDWCQSVFVKAAERSACRLLMYGASTSNGVRADFDLATGTIIGGASVLLGTFADNAAGIEALAATGWYRIWVSGTTNSDSSVRFRFDLRNASSNSYTGDGSSGLLLWGGQLERGTAPSSYIPTAASTVTRLADEVDVSLSDGDYDVLERREDDAAWLDVTTTGGGGWTIPEDMTDPFVREAVIYADGAVPSEEMAALLAGGPVGHAEDTAGRLTINAEAEGQTLKWPE